MDYTAVTTLKMTALRMAWKQFSLVVKMSRWQRSGSLFCAKGKAPYWQAAFDALHAWQVQQDPLRWGLAGLAEGLSGYRQPEVKAFCVEGYEDDVSFYLWLQWLATESVCRLLGKPASVTACRSASTSATWRWASPRAGSETWRDRTVLPESIRRRAAGYSGPAGPELGPPPMDPAYTLPPAPMSRLSTCCAPICRTAARCASIT